MRLLYIFMIFLIVWGSLFTLFWLKTDEITKNPCKICAEKLGEDVMCWTIDNKMPITKTFETENVTILY